mgnify:CR=1 FL=1
MKRVTGIAGVPIGEQRSCVGAGFDGGDVAAFQLRLKDVADTVDDAENTRLAAWAGTADTGAKPGVMSRG